MIRTQIQLTERQATMLRRIARQRRVSMAAVIREAVDGVIVEVDRHDAVERAIASLGGFSGGGDDVAREHDRYLYDAYGA